MGKAKKMWIELMGAEPTLSAESAVDELERQAALIQANTIAVLDRHARAVRTCPRLKRWWNYDGGETKKNLLHQKEGERKEG